MADSSARARIPAAAASQSTSPPPLLRSPWLSHELFAATKRAASAPDGLALAKKSAVAKVAQELKRSRNYLTEQLRELESQLLNVTDFLNGTRTTVFTDRGLPELVESYSDAPGAVAVAGNASMDAISAAAARRGDAASNVDALPTSPNSAGLRSKFVQHNFPGVTGASGTASLLANAMGTAVEDDLAADTPCTTIGLWKYTAAYEIFRDVTPEDVDTALQLEDPTPESECEADVEFVARYKPSVEATEKLSAHVLGAASGSPADDFLKARLVAALAPVAERSDASALSETTAESEGDASESQANGSTGKARGKKRDAKTAPDVASWSARGVAATLRDVGLLECSDDELRKRMLHPEDDEVSSELRDLQLSLRDHVRRTNETKRVLRNLLQTTKPWLSTQAETNQAIEKKFVGMWRRKKELERKQKLKDKKLMRREALLHSGTSGAVLQLP